ncbi:MAG: hypothetical protein ACRDZ4_15245 [Egibacteraceae bacterium]
MEKSLGIVVSFRSIVAFTQDRIGQLAKHAPVVDADPNAWATEDFGIDSREQASFARFIPRQRRPHAR